MPWEIREQGGKHCVFKKGAAEPLHCYASAADAKDYLAALYANSKEEFSAETITRSGLIFRCGDYPDKNFSLNREELAAAVAGFEPCPVDLSHVDTVLDGQLGQLEGVEVGADGVTLLGRVALPRWLDERLAEGGRRVSCTWDRTAKKLLRLALVPNPRVADAVLMSDTAEFEFEFTDVPTDPGAGTTAARSGRGDRPMSFMDKLKALFGKAGVPEDEIDAALKDVTFADAGLVEMVPGTPPADPKPTAKEQQDNYVGLQRIATLEAQLAAEREARLKERAAAFAAEVIQAKKALPAEAAALTGQYLQAARDDAAHGGEVTFGEGQQGTRVDALKAAVALRPAHRLTDELLTDEQMESVQVLFARQKTETDAEKPVSEERKKQLLGMTSLGQAVLNDRNGKGA